MRTQTRTINSVRNVPPDDDHETILTSSLCLYASVLSFSATLAFLVESSASFFQASHAYKIVLKNQYFRNRCQYLSRDILENIPTGTCLASY